MTTEEERPTVTKGNAVETAADIRVDVKGRVRQHDAARARETMQRIATASHEPVLSAHIFLAERSTHDAAHQAEAAATLNLNGSMLRARATLPSMGEALASLEEKLKNQLSRRADRRRHDPTGRPPDPGSWRHGNSPTDRGVSFDRPPEERALTRHKSFTTLSSTVEEAAWDMEQMNYDFFLFVDEATGADAVITVDAGSDEPRVIPLSAAQAMSVDDATSWLDMSKERFVFFADIDTDRGAVIYRRYDGDYGLLTPR